MARIQFRHVNKIYANRVQAVHDFTLEIQDEEFVVFVGPSGCGKSTTLRMVAGLEDISSGELYIDDVLINDVEPKDRDIAMVFQTYALYPHMTVYDNMAFALKLRDIPRKEIDHRVREVAAILGLEEYLEAYPRELSGGQRQRVALGRAIVRRPKVFLMDEPLSNLDAKLRVQMRAEILRIHNETKVTTIYVTHDQTEAMTMASRIVIMKDGFIQQIGTPRQVYTDPNNRFVAGFIGSPSMNFLYVRVQEGRILLADSQAELPSSEAVSALLEPYEGQEVVLGIRPESVALTKEGACDASLRCELVELLGQELIVHGRIGAQEFVAKAVSNAEYRAGDVIGMMCDPKQYYFFDRETSDRIR